MQQCQGGEDTSGVAGLHEAQDGRALMALPMTTQRAALAAAHPVHLVEPDATARQRPPARSPTLPFSCSTNLANDVTDHLRQAKLTASAWEVCAYLQRQTFG